MKKLLLSFIVAVSVGTLSAQVICDFETSLQYGPVIIGGSGLQTTSLVANPAPDAVNSSQTVLKANAYSIDNNGGNKIDAVMFQLPEATTFQANDFAAVKVNIYVTGGTPATVLKPRGKAGIWNADNVSSPAPGIWIGVVKNRVDGEDGLAPNQSGWMQCYFDISTKTQTDNYDAFHIQLDWNDERAEDLEIYFDDFELVTEIPDNVPTSIGDELVKAPQIINDNNLIKINSETVVSEVVVFDMTGRVVSQLQGDEINQINIANLPGGLYIVKAKAEGKVYTEKVLKR
ncbi:T9SS type A sorting domain-containing protein [Carboxylicivirga sediminis]|uniref:T9SS type A sorting domain-containing protein n=1 Tax=Carboxylicivirga sediminis TaxID=2006564 RepID=A0A941F210_9BACT|nr:T9SS type A sorting domain-containing protein [Carboxylicivirga sediminis]MBR8534499.1 T9SS type A sorting domain-containing protein [Carboxylicivirga sediminis]